MVKLINQSRLIRRWACLPAILLVLVLAGQIFAQDRGINGEPQLVCLRSQLTPDNDTDDFNPVVSDDYIVWTGYPAADEGEIYAMNRATGAVTRLTDNTYEDMNPQIDGDYVVWQYLNPDNDTFDIALHNLATDTTEFLNPNTSEDRDPMIDGNTVVWSQAGAINRVKVYDLATDTLINVGVGFGNDTYWAYALQDGRMMYRHVDAQPDGWHHYLYVYDVATATSTLVSGDLPSLDGKYDVQLDGNIVVWENQTYLQPETSMEIYAYDLGSETLTRITNNDHLDIEPTVQGRYLAYIRETAAGSQMRLRDLETSSDKLLKSENELAYFDPYIEGDLIAWQSINGLYAYHIGADDLFRVTENEGNSNLALDGNQIFWSEFEPGADDYDLFRAKCGFKPGIVTQPEDIEVNTGGMAMLSVVAEGSNFLKYQWYEGDATDSSTPIPGATNATYLTPPMMETTKFWVRVSNQYGSVESERARVVVSDDESTVTATTTATPDASATATTTSDPDMTATPTLEVTPTPSSTPTSTPSGSVQLLTNGDFEVDADEDKIPDGWTGKGTKLEKADKLKRNKVKEDGTIKQFAYSGEAAFMFKGNPGGDKSKLQYNVTDFAAIPDNYALEFSVYVNRRSFVPDVTIGKVKIKFSDGSKQKLQLTTPATQGYAWVSDSWEIVLAGRTIEKVSAEFGTKLTSGKFLIDAASLLVIPLVGGEASSLQSGGLIPLP